MTAALKQAELYELGVLRGGLPATTGYAQFERCTGEPLAPKGVPKPMQILAHQEWVANGLPEGRGFKPYLQTVIATARFRTLRDFTERPFPEATGSLRKVEGIRGAENDLESCEFPAKMLNVSAFTHLLHRRFAS